MQFEIDDNLIKEHFTEGQIQGFMRELNFTRMEAVLYLFMFNNICSFKLSDLRQDCGRAMYRKFAKGFSSFMKEKDCNKCELLTKTQEYVNKARDYYQILQEIKDYIEHKLVDDFGNQVYQFERKKWLEKLKEVC